MAVSSILEKENPVEAGLINHGMLDCWNAEQWTAI